MKGIAQLSGTNELGPQERSGPLLLKGDGPRSQPDTREFLLPRCRLVQRSLQGFEGTLLVRLGVLASKYRSHSLDRTARCVVVATAIRNFGLREGHVRAPIGIARKLRNCRCVDLLQKRT